MASNYDAKALEMHKKHRGKLTVQSAIPVQTKDDLSTAYTPGVAAPCLEIAADIRKVYDYTIKSHTVGVITDGSAVLGLGNIGPEASLPVMEGKALLFKEFANVDAFPIALTTQNAQEIIETVKRISPVFGGINLEDISAPRCFEIEDALQDLGIPVFHDDQHGTAIVVAAGLVNALKLAQKELSQVRILINGVGAAGVAIAKLLMGMGAKNLILCDSKGAIYEGRDNLNSMKESLAKVTNLEKISGDIHTAIQGIDVFIGVSKADLLNGDDVKAMGDKPMIFAMANPVPEIMPDVALAAGAFIVATGRSDFPNQVNNVLAFPGIFKGALDAGAKQITPGMKMAAVTALANYISEPTITTILPSSLDKEVANSIACAVEKQAKEDGICR
ncbi:MAG: malate dehydrogenase (oxaloacetate-decarboxylating) [Candidatus Woesearchaeota archaeon]|jgi:malate dehydrogenase (oxaloacetate-decarboxylating)